MWKSKIFIADVHCFGSPSGKKCETVGKNNVLHSMDLLKNEKVREMAGANHPKARVFRKVDNLFLHKENHEEIQAIFAFSSTAFFEKHKDFSISFPQVWKRVWKT